MHSCQNITVNFDLRDWSIKKDLQLKDISVTRMEGFGALNTRGFSSQIEYGVLPQSSHLTYQGVFNEIKFDVGKVTELPLDLQLGYARYQFTNSTQDKNINDYLALFVKGNKDGKDRDDRPINAVLCLDISGSMGGGLGQGVNSHRSRLNLSVQAIRMFLSKLRPSDSFGLITFDTQAKVIIQQTKIKQLNLQVAFKKLESITTGGGTTIRYGFQESQNMLYEYVLTNECQNSENRIIMLTDVCDNSIANERVFLEKAASQTGTTLTIIGISDDFRSEVCEQLKNVKGFNYFCAVDQDDIKKYVFQNFNFAYFPSAFNLEISLQSKDVSSFKVYGSTDASEVETYNNHFKAEGEKLIISRMKSSFPSQIEIINDRVHNYGGLILLKLQRKSKVPFFKGKICLSYDDTNGKRHNQDYLIDYEFHPQEQFFSDQTLRVALEGFTFVSEMKMLLEDNQKNIKKYELYEKYWPIIPNIEHFAPESKKGDLESIKKILKEYEKIKEPAKGGEEMPSYMM